MINLNKNMRRRVLSVGILKWVLIVFLFILVSVSCRRKSVVLKSPPGYDFSGMERTKLDLDIREISGIAWDHVKNQFAVVCDERGRVYYLDRETKIISDRLDFIGKGDYEDIAFVNSVPYILRSDGLIVKCQVDSAGNISGTEIGKLDVEGSTDFESLYYDPTRKALIMICKNCGMDDKKKISAFAYYLDSTGFNKEPVFQIDVAAVESKAPQKTTRPEPSGAAIHPVLQKLFILSSASNQLIITDLNGNVEGVYVLASGDDFFKQPEGICFKQNGDMYITNEGITGSPTLIMNRLLKK